MRRGLLPTLLVLLAFVAGCSALRVGYRHADTFLAWRADEYFDFDQRQKCEFNARLDRLLAWHRYEQLPDYAVFVNTAIKKAQPGLEREDILWFVDGIRSRYRDVVEHGVADAVEILAGLTPDQIVALQKQWGKNNRRFTREHALDGSLAQRKAARRKRMLNQITDWTGDLTAAQEQKIGALIETIPHVNHLRHQDRLRRQQEFLELLKLRADKQAMRPRLQAWLSDWERGRTAEYKQLAEEVYNRRVALYIAVDRLLTPAQRHTALRRLQEFADDFLALSKKPPGTASYPRNNTRLAYLCLAESHACLPE